MLNRLVIQVRYDLNKGKWVYVDSASVAEGGESLLAQHEDPKELYYYFTVKSADQIEEELAYENTYAGEEVRRCKDCGKVFMIYPKEVKFYQQRGLSLPKRCESCRQKRKNAH